MKNWTRVFASTAFAAIGGVALAASAYGQERFEQVPTNCQVIADEVFVDGSPFTSSGTMDLDPGEVSPDDEPLDWMQLINVGFSAQTDDPDLGVVTWDLDDSRPVETSILRSNQEDALFPATVQLDFNVRATISTQDGRVFLSSTPISITNSNIESWPPGDIELETVDADGDGEPDPVEFFDEETGEVAFVVNRLRSRVRD